MREPDAPYNGQAMAIGLPPGPRQKFLSKLPLYRQDAKTAGLLDRARKVLSGLLHGYPFDGCAYHLDPETAHASPHGNVRKACHRPTCDAVAPILPLLDDLGGDPFYDDP